MSTPTPDEITAALAVLRRVPGVRDIDSIGVIERKNAPIWRMTRELNELAVATDLTPVVLAEVAARHGLHITTDHQGSTEAHGVGASKLNDAFAELSPNAREFVAATAWKEPADWPIPGHAPGLYSMYSAGDANGAAVITEHGRLLVQQSEPVTDRWHDHTDIYQSAQWPLTPVTVRITTDPEPGEPGELAGHFVLEPDHSFGGKWIAIHRRPGDLSEARSAAKDRSGRRTAAVYLLPEGGKA